MSKATKDAVDAIVGQWTGERPDLDASAKQVTGRIVRLASLIQRAFAERFREAGLGEGSYGVSRRCGARGPRARLPS